MTQLEQYKTLAMLVSIIVLWLLTYTTLRQTFRTQLRKKQGRRLNQLRQVEAGGPKRKKTEAESNEEFIHTVTTPVITHVLPRLKIKSFAQIEEELKFTGMDKTFNAEQFIAMDIVMKLLGVGVFLLFLPFSAPIGAVVGGLCFFLFRFNLTNEVKNKQTALITEFPDFIELLQGYLGAGYDFVRAVNEIYPEMDAWRPYLKEFSVITNFGPLSSGLAYLQSSVRIQEVRELISIIKLGIDQGVDIGETLANQSESIDELKELALMKKIQGRQMMAFGLQGPLLLTLLVAFGLPTFYSMMNMQSM